MKKKLLSLYLKLRYFILILFRFIPILKNIREVKRIAWVKNKYFKFGQSERERIFLSIARYAHINRPIKGYYFEFGSNEGNTFRKAWDNFNYLFDWTFVAFDSFEGLPEMEEYEKNSIFQPGNLKTTVPQFEEILKKHGIPKSRYKIVKGFYNESLNTKLEAELNPQKAAVIYIDCDLYSSTVDVLKFIKKFLQKGTIIVFDDWNCYFGDPKQGERRAWSEFLESNPELSFQEFVKTAEGMSFVCVNPS